jgi:hypothetical protein
VIETAIRLARESGGLWTGTATELLDWAREWWPNFNLPGSPSALSLELRAAAPYLRDAKGVEFVFRVECGKRLIDVRLD